MTYSHPPRRARARRHESADAAGPAQAFVSRGVPASAFQGRVDPMGKTFVGRIEGDRLRVDCRECPEFWLHVDLRQVVGPATQAASAVS